MVRQLSERHTITIPKEILDHIGSKPGDYFEITDDGRRIILIPKVVEDKFSNAEWKKLERIAEEKGKVYTTAAKAKRHLEEQSK
jgi:AbrB family looped-hinge helix DNA binding protein